jgi:hypothetical protein
MRTVATVPFAWLIATKEVSDRTRLRQDALAAAERAIVIFRKSNYLDTLGCGTVLLQLLCGPLLDIFIVLLPFIVYLIQ